MGGRFAQLISGLLLYGFTMALMVQSGLGLDPWDVFHGGLTHHVPLTFGQVVIVVGAIVLLLWIPLKQRPGIGTVLNVILIGLAADAGIALISPPEELWARIALMLVGIVGNGLAGALYIGARLGAGPRDGIWVALVERTGLSVRLVRTGMEVTVLATGFLLGGTVGIGTALYALAIGPLVQFFLGRLGGTPREKILCRGGQMLPRCANRASQRSARARRPQRTRFRNLVTPRCTSPRPFFKLWSAPSATTSVRPRRRRGGMPKASPSPWTTRTGTLTALSSSMRLASGLPGGWTG